MRVARVKETYTVNDTYTIWAIGDTHIGAVDFDEDLLLEHLAEIAADPNARIIFMGDIGDLIDWRDKRFSAGMWPQRYQDAMHAEGGIPSETVAHALELFHPHRKKIWAWLSGNHEHTIRNRYDREIGSEIAGALGCEYLGYGGFIRVEWHRKTSGSSGAEIITVFDVQHGWQAGRTVGAKINQLEKLLGESDSDVIIRGHSHEKAAHIFPSLRISQTCVKEWERVTAHTGSYKLGRVDTKGGEENHDVWEERKGFRRKIEATMGPPLIEMKIGQATHKISRSNQGANRVAKSPVKYRVIL